MTPEPKELTAEQETQLRELSESYKAASRSVGKAIHFDNPTDAGQVLLFLRAEAEANAVLTQIKHILGLNHPPN